MKWFKKFLGIYVGCEHEFSNWEICEVHYQKYTCKKCGYTWRVQL